MTINKSGKMFRSDEEIQMSAVNHVPNEVTKASFEEAKAGKLEGLIDTTSVETMLESMGL